MKDIWLVYEGVWEPAVIGVFTSLRRAKWLKGDKKDRSVQHWAWEGKGYVKQNEPF